jgi:hypothetical protein
VTIAASLSSRYARLEAHQTVQLWVLVSFLLTFGIVRAITHLQKAGLLPNQTGDGLHIHHLVPGIILLLVSGYLGLAAWSHPRGRLVAAILFGIGAALTIDEFALWLFLEDVYWAREGRDSIDAAIIVGVLLGLGVLVSGFGTRSRPPPGPNPSP